MNHKKQDFMTTYLLLFRSQTPIHKVHGRAQPSLQMGPKAGSQERGAASLLFVNAMQHMNQSLGSKSLTGITAGDRDEPYI